MIVKKTSTRKKRRKQVIKQPKQGQSAQQSASPWQNHPAYRQWIQDFFQALFDFEFRQSITVKMLPLLYGVGIIASAGLAAYATFAAFLKSPWHGLGFLLVLGPLIFIFCTAALRSTLEFFSVVFRIQHNMHQMLGAMGGMRHDLRSMQNDMAGLAKAVEEVAEQAGDIASTINEAKAVIGEFEGITDRIPFFRKPKKPERDKNWAEAPLAEQYDLNPPGHKTSKETPSAKDSREKQAKHAPKRSKLVDLKSGKALGAKTLNFKNKEAANTPQHGQDRPQKTGSKPQVQSKNKPTSGKPTRNRPEIAD